MRNAPDVRGHRSAATLAVLSLVVMSLGCITAQQYCYVATAGTVRAVDLGMSVAGDLYREGKVTEAQKVKLVAAHDVYRPIAKAAVDGCQAVNKQGEADVQIDLIRKAADHVIEALVVSGVLK